MRKITNAADLAQQQLAEIRYTDPDTGAMKDAKPEAYHLIPWDLMDEVARVYGYGASKYTPQNWRKGYPVSLSVASAFRHLTAIARGEDIDPESGMAHYGHLVFHALAIAGILRDHPDKDDRWKPPSHDQTRQ